MVQHRGSMSRLRQLPRDLWARLLEYLRWKDTNMMRCVCSELRSIVSEAKSQYPEWRSTVLGPAANCSESIDLLRSNHLDWTGTRFAPDLVLLFAASGDPRPWQGGRYWKEAISVIVEEKLLPRQCKIVGMLTMNAVLGTNEERTQMVTPSTVMLSICVAHFPNTTVEMEKFDRKDLRRRCVGKPFNEIENVTPSFLLFGVNNQSASQLLLKIEEWYPGAAVVGAVSPINDRCEPLTMYASDNVNKVGRQVRKGSRQAKYLSHRQRLRDQTVSSQAVFPSTMLLCLNGNVGINVLSANGFHPITPVIQCVRSISESRMGRLMTHALVSVIDHQEPQGASVVDVLESSERLAMERETTRRILSIFSCHESAPLQHVLACCNSNESMSSDLTSTIERLDNVYWFGNRSRSFGWQEGSYGIVASHDSTRVVPALKKALQWTQARSTSVKRRAFGAFVAAGALNEMEDSVLAKEIEQLCTSIVGENQLGGCIVSASVGPVAFFNGVQPFGMRNTYQVQTHTTCAVIFVTKS